MNAEAERTTSLWMATAELPSAPALAEDIAADIVVVGGGIAGLSVAYEAARRGHAVVVVDRGRIGGGMTARTSAHLTSSFDDYYHEHIRMRGLDEARAYYHSQSAAIDRIEDIQQTEGLSCGFARVDGYMFLAPGTDPMLLDREIESCHRVGFDDVPWVDRAPFGTSATGRCLKVPRQGRFHPIK